MKKSTLAVLLIIFVLGFLLRVLFLPKLALTFGYDQARDAYAALEIAHGHLKVLGPPASTPGLYHGVLYYYVLAPAYLIGKGSPIAAAYWISFLNALAIFIVYALGMSFTKNKKASILAAFFFAISFEASQYANWLSNPTIGIFTVPLIYLGLWNWVKNKKPYAPILTGLALGLSIQAEVFLLYHLVPVLLWLWIGRKNLTSKSLFTAIVSLLAAVSTMALAEIKFGFKGIAGIQSLLSSHEPISAVKSLGDTMILYLNQLGKAFAFNSYPGNVGYGSVFILLLLLIAIATWYKRLNPNKKKNNDLISWEPFLASWLLCHITVVSVGGTSTPFLLVGVSSAVALLLGITIEKFYHHGSKMISILITAVLIFGNISMIMKENPNGQTIFSIQKDMVLEKQIAAIDYTYHEADNRELSGQKEFSINSLTSPLWINIVWTYLYNWYGQPKYGYVPYWHGRDQIGLQSTLAREDKNIKLYYLIIEPMGGIPERYLGDTISQEDSYSKLIDEKYFGELRIQKRLKI